MPGIPVAQYKALVVQPALALFKAIPDIGPALCSAWAINQISGTGLTESGLAKLTQDAGGPALGLLQMEPFTHNDIWATYLAYEPAIAAVVRAAAGFPLGAPPAELVITNLTYGVLMARLKYWRSPLPAPAFYDAVGCAAAWKNIYNSAAGAGEAAAAVPLFQQAITA
jgi:hypothetical protein